jgi:hypothetical protein
MMEEDAMPNNLTHTRPAKLRDIPLIKRLADKGVILDSEMGYTRELDGPNNALLTNIFLPQRGLYTLVARGQDQQVVGQFRIKTSDHLAQIVMIAPRLNEDLQDTAWLHVLDAMSAEAGKHGAHVLTAEVDELSPLFQTMRTAGFAVYARQEIWRREPGPWTPPAAVATLTEETDADAMDIQLLYCNIVPRLVQQIAVPSSESTGWVYRQDNRIQGYVAVSEGKYGVYLLPYLHPDVLFNEASAILAGAINCATRVDKVPVYICVRRYQDWLEEALIELGFESCTQQAVMVRHITAGIRQASFAPLSYKLEAISSTVRPPTSQIADPIVEIGRNQE